MSMPATRPLRPRRGLCPAAGMHLVNPHPRDVPNDASTDWAAMTPVGQNLRALPAGAGNHRSANGRPLAHRRTHSLLVRSGGRPAISRPCRNTSCVGRTRPRPSPPRVRRSSHGAGGSRAGRSTSGTIKGCLTTSRITTCEYFQFLFVSQYSKCCEELLCAPSQKSRQMPIYIPWL